MKTKIILASIFAIKIAFGSTAEELNTKFQPSP